MSEIQPPPPFGSYPQGPTGGFPPAQGGFGYQNFNPGPPPNNYLVWAILTTVLCCVPLGIVSIVKAAEVNGKWAQGDYAGAHASAAAAKKWALWGAGISAVGIAVYVLFIAAAVGTGVGY